MPAELGTVERNPIERGAPAENQVEIERDSPSARAQWLERIRDYVNDRQKKRSVIARTVTDLGQHLDWVEPESQTADGRIAEPPAADIPATAWADEDEHHPRTLVPLELATGRGEHGPKGTVPILHRDVAKLHPVGTLQDYLSKHGRQVNLMAVHGDHEIAAAVDTSRHVYAHSEQRITCYGTEGNINLWQPYVEWSDEFSLGQTWLSRGVGTGRTGKQTVEVGYQTFPNLYGDWVPHLFIFFTTNGYDHYGDHEGGYNQDVDGWVQVSPVCFPATRFAAVSSFGGIQYDLNLKVQFFQGNWWMRVNGMWMGYYPASLFNASGMADHADFVKWGGEISDSSAHGGTSGTDMGSGRFPGEGWQRTASMTNLAYQSSPNGTVSRYQPGYVGATNRFCYGIEGHFDNTSNWGPYFWWGGSGRNAQCP